MTPLAIIIAAICMLLGLVIGLVTGLWLHWRVTMHGRRRAESDTISEAVRQLRSKLKSSLFLKQFPGDAPLLAMEFRELKDAIESAEHADQRLLSRSLTDLEKALEACDRESALTVLDDIRRALQ